MKHIVKQDKLRTLYLGLVHSRLVYAVDRPTRIVRIFAVGHRRGIYEEIAARVRRP